MIAAVHYATQTLAGGGIFAGILAGWATVCGIVAHRHNRRFDQQRNERRQP